MARRPQADITTELVFDEARDNDLILSVGWIGQGRMPVSTITMRLREGRVWVENEGAEADRVSCL